jgi:hypothetical protein
MTNIEIALKWVDHLLGNGYPFDGLDNTPTRQVLAFLDRMHGLMKIMVITTDAGGMVETVWGWARGYKEAAEGTFVTAEELGKQRTFLASIRDQIAADKTAHEVLHRKHHAVQTGLEPTANAEVTGKPWGNETADEKSRRKRFESTQDVLCANAARADAVALVPVGKRVRR